MPSSTLVAWNPSHPPTAALDWALRRARALHGPVELVQVLDDVLTADGDVPSGPVAALEGAIERIREEHPGIPISGRVVHGFVVPALARETAMDRLLVIGRPERAFRLGSRWSFGSEVSAVAHGPVSVVPAASAPDRSGVVVGVDGSPGSWAAVVFAAEEAERTGQPLRIVHGGEDRGSGEVVRARLADHEHTIRDIARRLRTAIPGSTLQPELVLSSEPPARALLRGEPAPALVVIGSRRLTGLSRLLLGSVSDDLLAALETALVVVCPPERQHPSPVREVARTGSVRGPEGALHVLGAPRGRAEPAGGHE
ncbi:universal stress protein [Rathayibacter sp. VKM Ac-2759]|uniref:universal stress protein n=1 Tax=Rathayibacter sp. VKM Ac-2759 TaxID=2609252 RepID=UPI0013183964|nr:universal stress protein [Rathayibacter sp. VKM Ac-2759]QHC66678.1 universal stress protein [Rathayibacter sp. VKM Ac-2759]